MLIASFVLNGDSVLIVQSFYPEICSVQIFQQEIPLFFIEAVLFSSNHSLHRDLKRLFTNEPSYAIDYYGLLIERGGLRQACEHAMEPFIACCFKSVKFSSLPCPIMRARKHRTKFLLRKK